MDGQKALVGLERGAAAGLLATVPMTGVMEVLRHSLAAPNKSDAFIPRQVAEGIANRLGLSQAIDAVGRPGWWTLTAVSHFAFGGAAGAVYGLLRHADHGEPSQSPSPSSSVLSPVSVKLLGSGAGFGILVWFVHYLIIFPSLGILRPQADKPVRKNVNLICSHLVWGAVTALVFEGTRARKRLPGS